ncbi:MAG: hypothetical protein GY719_34430 [bacterium]|nr:hypothetical protein [bacterium]
MTENPRWKEVERLVSEDKLAAASEVAGEILAAAREAGDDEEQTRALIKQVQLRTGLHGYETAVRFLKEEPWPEAPLQRAALDLFYARSLVNYLRSYSWDIRQRERVDTGEEIDLKAWTKEQIAEEAQRAYVEVWKGREEWGSESLGALAEYLEQNTYPARIRGTLRDAVTYLWVGLLADTSLWRPEHDDEIYRLDVEAMASDDPEQVALDDPEVHPLLKMAAVLADLERWHRSRKQPEAALEARMERADRLWQSLENADDWRLVYRGLERALDRLGRRYEWWSWGMATLADFVRHNEGDLVEARRIALEGAEAHPESPGGLRCRRIVAEIEAPAYDLTAMASDGPERRSIRVHHRNLPELHLRAYAVDLRRRVEQARDRNLLPGHREVTALMASSEPAAEWTVELPATPDYVHHRTFVTPPMTAPGLYVIAASARRDFAQEFNHQTAVNMIVSDLVLVTRSHRTEVELTVRSGESGRAIEGARVDFYRTDYRQGHKLVESRTSGNDGTVHFAAADFARGNHFALARHGDQVALTQNVRRPYWSQRSSDRTSTLIYTDRSVYRPQQKILWKAVAYRGGSVEAKAGGETESGRFQVFPEAELTIELKDANGQTVATAEVVTNRYGSASGEFEIPTGRLLGGWSIHSSLSGSTGVRVEEYKRPTFEAEILDPESPMRLNREATLTGEVRYYFGLPVVTGEVAWRATREPVYPRWGWYRWSPQRGTAQTLAAGETELDAEGRFRVTFTPEADERLSKEVSYRYRLSVDVTDEGGETRSASRAFRLGFVAVEATLDSEADFFRQGEPAEIVIRRTDLNGVPRAGKGSWKLLSLEQPERAPLPAEQPRPPAPEEETESFETPGDGLQPRWVRSYSPEQAMASWSDGRRLRDGQVEHGENGEAKVSLDGLAPGAYRLRYTTTDAFGEDFEIAREIVVVGERTPLAVPLTLMAERDSVPVGDVARFFVHTGLEDQQMLLEVYRAGLRIERRALQAGELVEIPVGTSHRGGFSLQLTGLRDHQMMTFRRDVFVPWDDRRLEVEFATFRDRLRPGDEETWRVVIKGSDEEALGRGAAEVLAYMYDRSLDIFAQHRPFDLIGIYPRHTGVIGVQSSLGSASPVWQLSKDFVRLPEYPRFTADRLKFYDGYGIGGPGRRRRSVAKASRVPLAPAQVQEMAPQDGRFVESMEVVGDAPEVEGTLSATYAAAEPAAEPEPPGAPLPPDEPVELRTDFSETAFWEPHLVTGEDGSVAFEFTVPDSVTEWNVWVHALTRDLRGGSLQQKAKTVKELLVRPYLPRFFREGDVAELEVVVNNAGETELSGVLDFEIIDPDTEESLLSDFGLGPAQASGVPFNVAPGGGTSLTFPVEAPARVGPVAFRVIGRADDFSDGELRPLPVLPGRLHLAQSRFATLHDEDRRTLVFEDLLDEDPTRIDEQLVVTLDAQLFYSVLHALPYLVEYPYECTEQLLNRFLSTGIVSSLYEDYPAVAKMAKELSARETVLEPWDADDPNRKMALEETPWLRQSRGGPDPKLDLINVLDPEIAGAQREASLAKLRNAQTSLGGFPWWPGGPPSPYMTLYLLQGFSRALEFEVAVPQDMVTRAWSYMHRHYLDRMVRDMQREDCCWEFVTYMNYVLSSYPDDVPPEAGQRNTAPEAGQRNTDWTGGVFTEDDRRKMLDFSFTHWRQHSPRLKGYLALTLQRAGREEDARLVFDSVMDSSKTTQDEGTFWAPEDRAWLWYNDTIETHAQALRTLTELGPDDARRHGLVQWLLFNKKLNHWKSTRATAEVIYSLVHYLEREGALGVKEEATVTLGDRRETFTWEPDRYEGKSQLVLVGEEIDPQSMSTIEVAKETPGFMFASATWHFSTEKLPEEARGDFFSVTRKYFKRVNTGREWILQPLTDGAALQPGDQLEVQISLRAKHAAEYVHLRDPRGAGFEPETTASSYKWDLGIGWYEEVRDSGTNFFFEWLPAGEYTFKYRLRATLAGTFRVGPATVQSMYAPEFVGYSAGAKLGIEPGG